MGFHDSGNWGFRSFWGFMVRGVGGLGSGVRIPGSKVWSFGVPGFWVWDFGFEGSGLHGLKIRGFGVPGFRVMASSFMISEFGAS